MHRPELVICGYGAAGKAVRKAFERRGLSRSSIAVVEWSPQRADAARALGIRSICGDASELARLRLAGVGTALEIVICVTDDHAPAVAGAVRHVAPQAGLSAVVKKPETGYAVKKAGVDTALVLSELAGQLLAEAAIQALTETRSR